jgi:hypothetical protein
MMAFGEVIVINSGVWLACVLVQFRAEWQRLRGC